MNPAKSKIHADSDKTAIEEWKPRSLASLKSVSALGPSLGDDDGSDSPIHRWRLVRWEKESDAELLLSQFSQDGAVESA